ncbi:hypothetical protein DM860_005328 [Cuscuta australis]|uniref:Uncharacterized protein n=1 Tax=Cuscuta australis TaxID=267555 RepID=A0A328DZ29_9ASTE|nr:hypothetical protein DM860_005328 [Cuscuta australis]
MEDRFSVLIMLVNQLAADGFYCNYTMEFRSSSSYATTKLIEDQWQKIGCRKWHRLNKLKETQANITSRPMLRLCRWTVNTAMERLAKADVKYGFVLDFSTEE